MIELQFTVYLKQQKKTHTSLWIWEL